jgi:hypothetical protein
MRNRRTFFPRIPLGSAGNPMERAAAAKPHAPLHTGFLSSP